VTECDAQDPIPEVKDLKVPLMYHHHSYNGTIYGNLVIAKNDVALLVWTFEPVEHIDFTGSACHEILVPDWDEQMVGRSNLHVVPWT